MGAPKAASATAEAILRTTNSLAWIAIVGDPDSQGWVPLEAVREEPHSCGSVASPSVAYPRQSSERRSREEDVNEACNGRHCEELTRRQGLSTLQIWRIIDEPRMQKGNPMTTYVLSAEQLINIVLTFVIAVAVIAQAWFTRTQARMFKESERRAGTVTNAGFVDIEIRSFAFEVGRMLNNGEDDYPTAEIMFQPVTRLGQATFSTMLLPHRLRHGESFSVLYDRAQLVEESTKLSGETPVHMRPYCHDSLRNKHMLDVWIVYRKGNNTSYVGGPTPGRISEEDWNQLKPAERQRGSRWSRRSIGA